MSESIFTTQVPDNPDASDATEYVLGTAFVSDVAGHVTHMRAYVSSTPPSFLVGILWLATSESAGTELGRATYVGLTAGWNQVALASPVPIDAGAYYIASFLTPNSFALSSGGLATPVSNGSHLTTVDPAVFGNGRIHVGDGYPEISSGARSNYFADVVFSPNGTGPAAGSQFMPFFN